MSKLYDFVTLQQQRGGPALARLPEPVRRILTLARTTYVGFNDYPFCEKLREVEDL